MKIIEKKHGSDIKIQIEITTDAGAVEDLTGGTLALIIKANKSDADADAIHAETKTAFDAPTTGAQYFYISAAASEEIEPGIYYGEFRYTDADTKINFSDAFQLRITERIFE